MFGRNKKEDDSSYQELTEKQTTKFGYFLLILLFLFIVGISQTIFGDLRRIPERPISPSSCFNIRAIELQNYRSYRTTCNANSVDIMFDLDDLYSGKISLTLTEISNKNDEIRQLNLSINSAEKTIKKKSDEYNLSLQEKMADETVLYNTGALQQIIQNERNSITQLQQRISALEREKNRLAQSIYPEVLGLEKRYAEAQEHYKHVVAWYKFKIFLLSILYVIPLFAFSLLFYLRLKRKDSPHTIILTSVLAATSVLLLQIIAMFLYDIIPAKWIQLIFELFSSSFMRYILYYGSVLLTIGLFGGIVYYIQKKIFNPKRVALRRLKDNKCPKCSYLLNQGGVSNHCPNCGLMLRENCHACHQKRFVYLPYCPECGASQAKKEAVGG